MRLLWRKRHSQPNQPDRLPAALPGRGQQVLKNSQLDSVSPALRGGGVKVAKPQFDMAAVDLLPWVLVLVLAQPVEKLQV